MRQPVVPLLCLALVAGLAGCNKDLVCSADLAACDGRCVSLKADPANCGTCGNACGAGQTCSAAACRYASVTDCGAEHRACAEGERCVEDRCVADLYVACFNTGEVREATLALTPVGPPLAVAAGPIGLATLGGELYVASSAWNGAETLARIARDPPAVRRIDLWNTALTPDIQFLTAHGGYLYLSHNSAKALLVLTPGGALVEEHSFASEGVPNPNPLGIAFDGDVAYVALQARNEVAVLDVSAVGSCPTPGACIQEVQRIDVSALASPTAQAMPARVAIAGGHAYVTLWNLDASWSPPAGSHGRLAVIDTTTRALDTTIRADGTDGLLDLGAGCLNPGDVVLNATTLYVTCGAYGAPVHGQGIVPIDLSGPAPAVGGPLPAPDDAVPGDLAFCKTGTDSAGRTGYIADRNSGRVFRLDPVAGAVEGVELCPKDSSTGYAYAADVLCGD